MGMITAEQVTPRANRAVMPESFKGMTYSKLANGQLRTIVKVAFSVYKAKKETDDGKVYIERKDGSYVTKTTAYIGFDDGSYSTVGNEIAIGQLMSITDEIDENAEGVYEFTEIEPCKVKIDTKDIKYGDKSYPSWIFIPTE